MNIENMNLWNVVPGYCEEEPRIRIYVPDKKTSDGAIVIFPGGGYRARAEHEGAGYARFFAENGITSFVVDYRVNTHKFPCQLLDARRSVKFVRYYADKYGIDKGKIAVMGSSAGGHLAALCSTYFKDIDAEIQIDDIENENYVPNAQILCYPVIRILGRDIAHIGSGEMLLGNKHVWIGEELEPDRLVSSNTPPAFIWHTASDDGVSVLNSYVYAKSLKQFNIPTEMHIFPEGRHGLGLCDKIKNVDIDGKILEHTGQWSQLMLTWLTYMGF